MILCRLFDSQLEKVRKFAFGSGIFSFAKVFHTLLSPSIFFFVTFLFCVLTVHQKVFQLISILFSVLTKLSLTYFYLLSILLLLHF